MEYRDLNSSRFAILYSLVALILISFIVFELVLPEEDYSANGSIRLLDTEWELVESDGTRTPSELPLRAKSPRGEFMTVEAVLPVISADDDCIFFRGSQETCRIYVDDELRYELDTNPTRIFQGNSPSANIVCRLSPSDSGRTIRIELMSNTHFSGLLNPVYIGSLFDIWYSIVRINFLEACTDTFLFILGCIVMIGGLILRLRKRQNGMLEMLGLIIVTASLLTFTESHLRQLFVPNVSVVADLSYLIISVTLIAVSHFLDEVQSNRHTRVYHLFDIAALLDLIMNFVLAYFEIIELFNSMWITMSFIGILSAIFIVTVYRDSKNGFMREYLDIVVGMGLFLVSVLIGNFFVNIIDVIDGLDIFIAFGLAFLLIASMHNTIRKIVTLDRDKQKAIYDKKLKEKLFASISHDIRTPINGVMGLDETIIRDSTDPAIRESAKSIMNSSRMILSLVNDLLDFSKAESGQLSILPRSYRTVDLLCDSIMLVEDMAAQKELKLNIDIDPNLPTKLIGDDLRIRQVIVNLLSNAVKYTNEGSVTLFVTYIKDESNRDCLRITVRDTGRGIRETDIPKLFDTFTRFDEEDNRAIVGTGLGLSITKIIIELMNGQIVVESEYGKGSVFTVLIPQQPDDYSPIGDFIKARNARDNDTAGDIDTVCAPGAHILVVDDNPINLTVMKNLLAPSGVRLDLVNDGENAVDICRYKRFDLIFMDHMMPGMNGVEALELIHGDSTGLNTETPVIALTANETLGSCDMYKRYGFIDYLSKPVSTDALMKALRAYIPQSLIEDTIK